METVPLAALGDALADGTNYAVVSSTSDAGVSPSLLTGDTISDPVVAASSAGTGEPVAKRQVSFPQGNIKIDQY